METFNIKGGITMQTNNYEESLKYFLRNAQYGWKHIEAFILSEKMVESLLEEDLPGGSVIQLKAKPFVLRTKIRIKGYPIII